MSHMALGSAHIGLCQYGKVKVVSNPILCSLIIWVFDAHECDSLIVLTSQITSNDVWRRASKRNITFSLTRTTLHHGSCMARKSEICLPKECILRGFNLLLLGSVSFSQNWGVGHWHVIFGQASRKREGGWNCFVFSFVADRSRRRQHRWWCNFFQHFWCNFTGLTKAVQNWQISGIFILGILLQQF